jgi:hypothetical protein
MLKVLGPPCLSTTVRQMMNPDYILLSGIRNSKRLEDYFASSLVDIAYARSLSGGKVKVLLEPDTNLRAEKDLAWIMGIIVNALSEIGENDFTTEVILAP